MGDLWSMEQEDKNLHAQQPDEAQTPAKQPEPKGYEAYLSLFDLVRMLAVITLMFVFFFRVNGVSGSSMYPTLVDKDYLVLESNFLYQNARQGDIVTTSCWSSASSRSAGRRSISISMPASSTSTGRRSTSAIPSSRRT